MANLTPQQRNFVERYIVRLPSAIFDAPDETALAPHQTDAQRGADAQFLQRELAGLAPPPGASADETLEIQTRLSALRGMAQVDASQTELRMAARKFEDLVEMRDGIVAAIADRAARRQQILDDAHQEVLRKPPDVRLADDGAIGLAAQAVAAALPTPSSDDQIATARGLLAQLASAVDTAIGNAEADRAEERQRLLDDADRLAAALDGEDLLENETRALQGAVGAIRAALPDPPRPEGILEARAARERLEKAVQVLRDNLAQRAEARAKRRLEIKARIAEVMSDVPGDARPEDMTAVQKKAGEVEADMPDPSSAAQMEVAETRLPELEALAQTAIRNAETDRLERSAKRAEHEAYVAKIETEFVSDDVTEEERKALAVAIDQLRQALPAPLGRSDLEPAQAARDLLANEVARIEAAIVKSREERAVKRAALLSEVQGLIGGLDAECAQADRTVAEKALAAVEAALPDPALDKHLTAAEALKAAVGKAVVAANDALKARRALHQRATALQARAVWGTAKLIPHERASAAVTGPVKQKAEDLAQRLKVPADWAQIKELPASEIGDRDTALDVETAAAEAVEKELEDLNRVIDKAVTDLAGLVARARAAVDDTAVCGLTGPQKQPFSDRIAAADAAAGAVLPDLSAAAPELSAIEAEARALSAAIRPLRARLSGVPAPPANALPGEIARLDKLRKAAEDALNGALEL